MKKVLILFLLFFSMSALGQGKDTLVILQGYESLPFLVTRLLNDSGKITLVIKNEDEDCYVLRLVEQGVYTVVGGKSTDGPFLVKYMPKEGGFQIRDCQGQFPIKEISTVVAKGYATSGRWVMVITHDRKTPGIVEYLRPWTPKDGWLKYRKWDLK